MFHPSIHPCIYQQNVNIMKIIRQLTVLSDKHQSLLALKNQQTMQQRKHKREKANNKTTNTHTPKKEKRRKHNKACDPTTSQDLIILLT